MRTNCRDLGPKHYSKREKVGRGGRFSWHTRKCAIIINSILQAPCARFWPLAIYGYNFGSLSALKEKRRPSWRSHKRQGLWAKAVCISTQKKKREYVLRYTESKDMKTQGIDGEGAASSVFISVWAYRHDGKRPLEKSFFLYQKVVKVKKNVRVPIRKVHLIQEYWRSHRKELKVWPCWFQESFLREL